MSTPNAAPAYRSLIHSIQTSSSRNLRSKTRRRLNVFSPATCPRRFSSSPPAFAAPVYTRPTSKPAATTAKQIPIASASTVTKPTTPVKPAIPVSSAPQATASKSAAPKPRSLTTGLDDLPAETQLPDAPSTTLTGGQPVDWSRSFHGLSATPFSKEAQDTLLAPLNPEDVEIKPDGIIYLPEIKYRRILNKAFGPGAWGLAPRGETIVTAKSVTREYGLVVHGRLVSIARGEQVYFDPEGIPTATEGCKSNALMRCCKDLGIASELWDPVFIRKYRAEYSKEVWVEQITTKKKRKIHMRKDVNTIPAGYKAS